MAVSTSGSSLFDRIAATLFALVLLSAASVSQAGQINWTGPAGSRAFGHSVAVLPNGNIVVTDPCAPGDGAAYLYTANQTLISKVTGILPGFDSPGCASAVTPGTVSIVILKNGNYLIANPVWSEGSKFSLGMVAWASSTTGLSGVISEANALLGSNTDDRVGFDGITVLANGNYVVGSGRWTQGRGAATWGNGSSGVSGRVSASNSLVGTSTSDSVGDKITALTNGNYVINAYAWRNPDGAMVGATTWANGATGINGTISEANSLVGSQSLDSAVSTVVALTNGNYVVAHPGWDNGDAVNAGAVTWGNGATGIVGPISSANSLIGARSENRIGFPRLVALTNGNYVVGSSLWEGDSGINLGAVTWGNGSTGLIGVVSEANSLVGDFSYEYIGDDPVYKNENVIALTNGNYVVTSPRWSNGAKQNVGAVTWGNGTTGTVGVVSAANSLTGSTSGDLLGVSGSMKIKPLTNGNYVVISANWHKENGESVGAATWVDGSAPYSGVVTSANSVPGVSSVAALSNGDFVVSSREWVTRGNGSTGVTAPLTLDTALATDGYSVPLADGSYVVCSLLRDVGAVSTAGSVTWSAANTAVVGEVSATNSLVGTTSADMICRGAITATGITALPDSRYVVYSPFFDSPSFINAEALTLGIGSLSGAITPQNSLIGTQAFNGNANGNSAFNFVYDPSRSGLVVGQQYANRVSIFTLNNDVGPNLSIGDVVIDEGNAGTKTATFTVQLSAASASPVTYDIGTANARAQAGTDYVARQLIGQIIPAGVISKTFTVTINGDVVPETGESFTVNVSNVVGAKTIDAQALGTIRNDDGAGLVIGDISISEGDSGGKVATFTASLFEASASNVSFDINTANGTAIAGSDYVASSLVGQSILAGTTSQSFSIVINGDTVMENDETFSVVLSNPVGASIVDGTAVGTITNDDFPILSVADVAIAEGASGSTGTMTFTVKLSIASIANVSYDVSTVAGSAQEGSDFVAKQLTGQIIPAGATSKTFTVTINGDNEVEPDEAMNLYVYNIVGSPTTQASPIGWILNDEGANTNPALSISDVSISEGENGQHRAYFTLSLSAPTDATVGYDIDTVDGTASSLSDYIAEHHVALRIPAGQTSQVVSVAVNGDSIVEPDETFHLQISNIINATAGDVQGTCTILNDDFLPSSLSIADASVTEGNSGARSASFNITLSAPAPANGVSFTMATGNLRSTGNAATANSDFAAVSPKVITIAAGQTSAVFNVKVLGDTRVENDERFNVLVSNINGAVATRSEAFGTIVNDDNATLQDDGSTTPTSGTTAISTIQGTGLISSMAGNRVVVQGIVTALRRDGFFLQTSDEQRDNNPATAEGLFVYTGATGAGNATRGNLVEITGSVREIALHEAYAGLTSTSVQAEQVRLIASGRKLPAAIELDTSALRPDRAATWLERFEGMRVSISRLSVISPTEGRVDDATSTSISDGRFYGVIHGTQRPFRESGIPDGNPERLQIDSLGQIGSTALSVDVGDDITGMVGVLVQGSYAYTVLPDPAAILSVTSGANPRAVSVHHAAEFSIGNINARRFFDDVDDPNHDEPVLTTKAYTLRLAKTANAICAYARSPDILGIAEVENRSVLSDLAEAVNSNAGNVLFPDACKGNPGYRALMATGHAKNGNLGFLVSAATVRRGVPRVQVLSMQEQGSAALFRHADGSSEALFEQVPLLLKAQLNSADGSNETVTILVNQLLAAGVDNVTQASYGWTTRTAYVRAKRRAQMQFLATLLRTRQAGNSRERIVVMGGFESNEFGDGQDDLMGVLTGRTNGRAGVLALTNMTMQMPKQQRYSVIREGNAEAVDHIIVSQSMLDGRYKLRTEFARINADFGEDNTGAFDVPVRVSDHDALVLYLRKP